MTTEPKIQERRKLAAAISVVAVAIAGLVLGPVDASAQSTAPVPSAKLKLDLSAQRFVVRGDRLIARGTVAAQVLQPDGTTEKVRKRVHLRVRPTHRCRILKLHLAPLFVDLLGLEARTSTVNLRIRGTPGELLANCFESSQGESSSASIVLQSGALGALGR